ncbi:MAG: hypothetical protein K6E28_10330 [Eubacterium sp.]|nr:hypothetical protein [Eubacterium sp.]
MGALSEGREYLSTMQEELAEVERLKGELDGLKSDQKKLEKDIVSTEKSIKNEIASTIKRKRNDLKDEYAQKTHEVNNEKKGIEQQKSRKRSREVAARVGDETSMLVNENKEIRKDIMRYLRENRVPKIFRNRVFEVLFDPVGLVDWGEFLAAGFVAFLLIPWLIYHLGQFTGIYNELNTANKKVFLVILVAVWIILVLVVYFLIYANVKMKYKDVFTQTRELRREINVNDKKINDIKRNIHRDKDDSKYDLDEFNVKIQLAEEKQEAINFDRNNALKDFDENVTKSITDEITEKRTPELEEKKKALEELMEKTEEINAEYDSASADIDSKYISELGADIVRPDVIDKLAKIMDEGKASTIGDAIEVLKGKNSAD